MDTFANPFGLDFLEAFLDRRRADRRSCCSGSAAGASRWACSTAPTARRASTSAPADAAAGPAERSPRAPAWPGSRSEGDGGCAGRRDEAAAPLPEEPYRSLAYYDREHRALFAGRDDDVAAIRR